MRARFEYRNTNVALTAPFDFEVVDISRMAMGGPMTATLEAKGRERDIPALLDLLNWVRAKVWITNERGKDTWWGYVDLVEVELHNVKVSADLDKTANRIAVAYTSVAVGQGVVGDRGTTDWAEDARSIRELGRKELLVSMSDTTPTGAEARRDRELESRKNATGGVMVRDSSDSQPTVRLTCRGWWSTLGWRYAPVPTLLALAFETIGSVAQAFGNSSIEQVAQAFDAASAVNLLQIGVYLAKIGTPADNVKVAIYSNPDDLNPTTELASQTVAGASLGTSGAWVTLTLSGAYGLTAGVSYFLVLSRSGAQDAGNYYVVTLDGAQGYGAGPFVRYNGSAWAAYAADMPFRLYANSLIETTQQIKSLITNFGQFLRAVRVEDASGVSVESYRDGDSMARYEIEQLLQLGTTNYRRLLADVDGDRNVRIYEQAASTNRPYLMDSFGKFYDPEGNPLEPDEVPAGVWVLPRDILAGVSLDVVTGLKAFFLEIVTYNVREKRLSYQPANLPDPFDMGVGNV